MSTKQTPAAQQSQAGMSRGLKSNFALRIGAVLLAAMPVLFSVTTTPVVHSQPIQQEQSDVEMQYSQQTDSECVDAYPPLPIPTDKCKKPNPYDDPSVAIPSAAGGALRKVLREYGFTSSTGEYQEESVSWNDPAATQQTLTVISTEVYVGDRGDTAKARYYSEIDRFTITFPSGKVLYEPTAEFAATR